MSTNSIISFHNHDPILVHWLSWDQQNWARRANFLIRATPFRVDLICFLSVWWSLERIGKNLKASLENAGVPKCVPGQLDAVLYTMDRNLYRSLWNDPGVVWNRPTFAIVEYVAKKTSECRNDKISKARGCTCPLQLILPFVFVDTHSSDVFFSVPHSTIDVETSFRLVASLVVNLTCVHTRSHC